METLDNYMALEYLGFADLFSDLCEPAEEGVVDNIKSAAKRIVEVIVKVLEKIIDLYRMVTLQSAVYVSDETGMSFDSLAKEGNLIKPLVNEVDVARDDRLDAVRNNIDLLTTNINDKYAEFSKIKTHKISKDDMVSNLIVVKTYFTKRYSITTLKNTLREMNDLLKTVKTKVSSEQDTKKIECYGKIVTNIVKIITATSRILYRPVQTNFS